MSRSATSVMCRLRLAAWLAMLLPLSAPGLETVPTTSTLSVDCDRPFELDLALTNPGHEPLSIFESQLPWSFNALGVQGYALVDGAATRMRDAGPVADYLGEVTLAPRATLRGTVPLDSYLPDIVDAADDSAVAVRVRAERLPFGEEEVVLQEWLVVIPQRGWLMSDCPVVLELDDATVPRPSMPPRRMKYEERVALQGVIDIVPGFGSPGHGETPHEDMPVRIVRLKLPRPISVPESGMYLAADGERILQLALGSGGLPEQGRRVEVTGELYGAHTAWHRTPVLVRVESWRYLDEPE